MVLGDDVGIGRYEAQGSDDHVVAGPCVTAHHLPFEGVQRPGLVQDSLWHAVLADVVEEAPAGHVSDLVGPADMCKTGQNDAVDGGVDGVCVRRLVLLHRGHHRPHQVLVGEHPHRDAVDRVLSQGQAVVVERAVAHEDRGQHLGRDRIRSLAALDRRNALIGEHPRQRRSQRPVQKVGIDVAHQERHAALGPGNDAPEIAAAHRVEDRPRPAPDIQVARQRLDIGQDSRRNGPESWRGGCHDRLKWHVCSKNGGRWLLTRVVGAAPNPFRSATRSNQAPDRRYLSRWKRLTARTDLPGLRPSRRSRSWTRSRTTGSPERFVACWGST